MVNNFTYIRGRNEIKSSISLPISNCKAVFFPIMSYSLFGWRIVTVWVSQKSKTTFVLGCFSCISYYGEMNQATTKRHDAVRPNIPKSYYILDLVVYVPYVAKCTVYQCYFECARSYIFFEFITACGLPCGINTSIIHRICARTRFWWKICPALHWKIPQLLTHDIIAIVTSLEKICLIKLFSGQMWPILTTSVRAKQSLFFAHQHI